MRKNKHWHLVNRKSMRKVQQVGCICLPPGLMVQILWCSNAAIDSVMQFILQYLLLERCPQNMNIVELLPTVDDCSLPAQAKLKMYLSCFFMLCNIGSYSKHVTFYLAIISIQVEVSHFALKQSIHFVVLISGFSVALCLK